MGLGASIRKIRERKGIKLTNLANKAGIAKTHLSAIERERIDNPSFKTVEKIAQALGTSLERMTTEESKREFPESGDSLKFGSSGVSLSKEVLDIPTVEQVARFMTDPQIPTEKKEKFDTLVSDLVGLIRSSNTAKENNNATQ